MVKTLQKMMLTALVMVLGSMMVNAATVSWSATSGNALNAAISLDDNVTLTFVEGGGDQAPKYSNGSVYFYNGNRLTVAAANSAKLTKIAFTFSGERNTLSTCDSKGKVASVGTWANGTWTGEESSVTFRASAGTGVRNISAIEVTYVKEGENVEYKAVLAITNATINATANLDNTPSVFVNYSNTGNIAAENAKLNLYVNGQVNKTNEIGTIAIGNGMSTLYYDAATIDAGEYDVYVGLTADGIEEVKSETVKVTFTKTAPEATFTVSATDVTVAHDAESYTVKAQVKNTSEINATDVEVKLLSGAVALATATVDVEAGATKEVELTVTGGPFAAGEKEMQVFVANKVSTWVKVTVEEAPVADEIDVELVQFMGLEKIDLSKADTVMVWYKNNSNVAVANASIALKVNGTLAETKTVETIALGGSGSVKFAVPTTGLTAGTATLEAVVSIEGDINANNDTITKVYDVVTGEPTEATYTVTANDVTVAYDAENYVIKAEVTNTSTVDAQNVEVKVLYGTDVVTSATIETIEAGAKVTVEMNVTGGPFAAGEKEMQVVVANKVNAWLKVTVEEAPVADEIDVELVQFMGLEKIDLSKADTVMVWYKNNSNVAVENVSVSLKVNGTLAETKTIETIALGGSGSLKFGVPTEGLSTDSVTLEATVSIEGDINADNNTISKKYEVVAGEPAVATFEVKAEDVTVAWAATSFVVKAKVSNTSDVDAKDVVVKLMSGIETLAADTIDVEAGKTVEVELNVTGGPFAAGEKEMQVVVTDKSAWINVTFEEEPVEEVIDLAISEVQVAISQEVNPNYITVFVENKGNVDVKDATVTVKYGETVVGTGTVSVKVDSSAICSIAFDATSFASLATFDLVATVDVVGDADLTNNTFTKTVTNTATGINKVQNMKGQKAQMFTLGGKKVNSVKNGQVVIMNGKKMVVK